MTTIVTSTHSTNPHVSVLGIRDDTSSRGVDLAGARFVATYADGSTEVLTWAALDPFTNGGASGADIDMFFGFAVHELTTTKLLRTLEIDLAPASSVFDITFPMDDDPAGGSTPSSNNGFPFRLGDDQPSLGGEIAVTYAGPVNLAGQSAVGDLFTTMTVDFSGLPGGGLLGALRWNSDIDTMRIAGDLVADALGIVGNEGPNDLDGGVASETLAGLAGNDTLDGGAGDDLIVGGAGADFLVGGAGSDTAAYLGASTGFTLTFAQGQEVTVADRSGAEGTDRVSGVEWIAFGDGQMLNLDKIDGVAALGAADLDVLIEVYIAYFNRAPDALGLYFWGNALADGIPLADIAALFLDQDETRATYPASLSNLEFATQVYSNVLGRTPDADGLAFWQGQLDSGAVSRDVFILEVLKGAKAAPPAGASQDFINLQLGDRAYLATKTDIGAHYAATNGLSGVADASAVMETFLRGDAGTIADAVALADQALTDALTGGEMLLQLVGVVDDPFAGS